MQQPEPCHDTAPPVPAMLAGVPNQPKTPQRSVRVPDDVWLAAKEVAEAKGETLSDVIRRALERYAKGQMGNKP